MLLALVVLVEDAVVTAGITSNKRDKSESNLNKKLIINKNLNKNRSRGILEKYFCFISP